MSFRKDNADYEAWLATQCDVVAADIRRKHKRMGDSPFMFLRATYFRWAKKIEGLCPTLADAPRVLAVGDTHVENYGTWRDTEGRLVWGLNDFDEAASMPYVFDLVRLAASARLAPGMRIGRSAIAQAILAGYREGLAHPRPALLDQRESWMRPYAIGSEESSGKFWNDMRKLPDATPPRRVARALRQSLPRDAEIVRFCSRVAGGGSLGRPRFVVIAQTEGGLALREAKALVPSAWIWAQGRKTDVSHLRALAFGRYRAPDPFLDVDGNFVIRRIAPDSHKIELGKHAGTTLKARLLGAMARDLAAIHAASPVGAKALRKDLRKRPRGWLDAAAKTMAAAVQQDFRTWKG
ncbi:MAG TPA: DUF2252 family protein [Tardiphaga sp.]